MTLRILGILEISHKFDFDFHSQQPLYRSFATDPFLVRNTTSLSPRTAVKVKVKRLQTTADAVMGSYGCAGTKIRSTRFRASGVLNSLNLVGLVARVIA
jgi:hypothetical protein